MHRRNALHIPRSGWADVFVDILAACPVGRRRQSWHKRSGKAPATSHICLERTCSDLQDRHLFRAKAPCDDFATHFPLLSGGGWIYGKPVHFLPQNRRSDCCKKARSRARPGRVKDRMNGTAREIASLFNSADSENCSPRPEFRVPAVLGSKVVLRLEEVRSSGTLKDTE